MSQVAVVDFTAGPAGASITAANTPAINGAQSGTKPVFAADAPPDYIGADFSAQVDLSGVISFNNITYASQPSAWFSFYFKMLATTAADSYWFNWYSTAGTKIGDIRFSAGAQTVAIRDNNTTQATSGTVALNTWHRAAVFCQPGSATGHRLKLYLGANLHGSVPDYDSGGLPATLAGQTNLGGFRFGLLSGAEAHYRIARIRVDSAVEPAPVIVPGTNDTWWLDTDGIWKSMVVLHLTGTGWV